MPKQVKKNATLDAMKEVLSEAVQEMNARLDKVEKSRSIKKAQAEYEQTEDAQIRKAVEQSRKQTQFLKSLLTGNEDY